jgi:hypothetical protein
MSMAGRQRACQWDGSSGVELHIVSTLVRLTIGLGVLEGRQVGVLSTRIVGTSTVIRCFIGAIRLA